MFVLEQGTQSLFGWPQELRSLAVSVPSAGFRSTRILITLYIYKGGLVDDSSVLQRLKVQIGDE